MYRPRQKSALAIYEQRLRNLRKARAAKRAYGGRRVIHRRPGPHRRVHHTRRARGGRVLHRRLVVRHRRVHRSKRHVAGRRVVHRRRVYRRRMYGGALTDYIPSLSTVASYIPGAETAASYLPSYSSIPSIPSLSDISGAYGQAKSGYETAKQAHQIYKEFLAPIPEPPPRPPVYTSPLAVFGKKSAPVVHSMPTQNTSFFQKLKKIRPISFVDNALSAIGQRDRVRKYLEDRGHGYLNRGADLAIQAGFGRVRRHPRARRHR